jgi:TonB family protein
MHISSRLFLSILLAGASIASSEVRISTAEALDKATVKPKPEYPAVARQMKVSGKVEVEVSIAPDGSVADAKALSGNPLLTGPTVSTLKRWKFTPFKENGEPAKAVTVLNFSFGAQ